MRHDLRDDWRQVVPRPWLWTVVVQFSLVNAVVSAAEAVYGPLVAEQHLGTSSAGRVRCGAAPP
ncbi:hypothetical protein [Streptomyces sp. KS_16]|uniref:hypothetical protein n=1 Tax=unclassified Streptomyces TaxID=2593676 RepID=UPI000B2F3149